MSHSPNFEPPCFTHRLHLRHTLNSHLNYSFNHVVPPVQSTKVSAETGSVHVDWGPGDERWGKTCMGLWELPPPRRHLEQPHCSPILGTLLFPSVGPMTVNSGEKEGEPIVRNSVQWVRSQSLHTGQGRLWHTETTLSSLYWKSWSKATRYIIFSQKPLTCLLKTQPSWSTLNKQAVSDALKCFKDVHTSIIANTPCKECKPTRSCCAVSLTAGTGRLLLAPGDLLLTLETIVRLLFHIHWHWNFTFTSNSPLNWNVQEPSHAVGKSAAFRDSPIS